MKYMIMIYGNPASWVHPMFLHQDETLSPDERDRRLKEFTGLLTEIAESGELLEHAALADPLSTKTIRVRDDVLTATDGPFLDSKEHLAGYFVVDCASAERAIEIAGRFPDARLCAVEVRPLTDPSEVEM